MTSFRSALLVCVGVMVALSITARRSAASDRGPVVAITLATEVNTLDGCTACGCRGTGPIEAGAERRWWIAFGLAEADPQTGWAPAGSPSHCGSGSFEETASEFIRTVGVPYVVMDLTATAARVPGGGVRLETELEIQKLSGFDQQGQPVFRRNAQSRRLDLAAEGDLTLPLLIADQHETDAFGVHDVFTRLQARVLPRPAARYGVVSVTADVPGAEVLLDGGVVGRTAEGSATVLENVLVGTREIRVRDSSGREIRRQVVVKARKTQDVAVDLLGPSPAEPRKGLLPIGKNPQGREEYWRAQDGAVVVRIPAGEFPMGSREEQSEADERPQHRVDLSEFLIDKTEVTWRQYKKIAAAQGTALPAAPIWGTPDDYPASNLTWNEAREFCEWVGGRLPTEAEWEKAARGTDGRAYPWGDTWDPDRCNSRDGGPHQPTSVASFPDCLSPYGVLDMAGNVREWCADWYGDGYYTESPSRDPRGPAAGDSRVLRGAFWMSGAQLLRVPLRYKAEPTWRNPNYGFRCVQDPPR